MSLNPHQSRWLPLLILWCAVACGEDETEFNRDAETDAGASDASPDAGTDGGSDLGPRDTGEPDAGLEDAGMEDAGFEDTGAVDAGAMGFIGNECATTADCAYAGAVCVTEGFDGGSCTQACTQFCPDRTGHPLTFCVDSADLLPGAAALGDGACFSRCDFALYPGTGCRESYGCQRVARANSAAETFVCLPGPDQLTGCHLELAAAGLGFEPTVVPDEHPDPPNDNLTCSIEDPVWLFAPIGGVDITYGGLSVPRFITSCRAAQSVAATAEDLAARGVVSIESLEGYQCRVIAGTSTVSRHGFADAFDVSGVTLNDGTVYTILDDWEVGTSTTQTPGGTLLYEFAHRMFDQMIWNVVLTPNYDAAHANHIHFDLTLGVRVIE